MQALTCPECGRNIPLDAETLGLCPLCLVNQVVSSTSIRRASFRHRKHAAVAEDIARELPQFQNLQWLGKGGMSTVFKADQPDQNRSLALKVFSLDEPEADPAFAERFAQEARLLISLNHSNIVGAYEVGQSAHYAFLAMQLVRGPNLRKILAAEKLSPGLTLAVAKSICDALEYAHAKGIVHRDIKPENILIDPPNDSLADASLEKIIQAGGQIRVADFGLAKFHEHIRDAISLTSPEHCVGTAIYMAPEQMDPSAHVDARADIYSLGVLLYEMLTGELPVGRFAPPSQKSSTSRHLDAVVLRCLENDPARRYQDIATLRTALSTPPSRLKIPLIGTAAAFVITIIPLILLNLPAHTPVIRPTTSASEIPSQPSPFSGLYFGESGDDQVKAWNVAYGPDHVARVYVTGIRLDTLHYIAVTLRSQSGASGWFQTDVDGNLSLAVAPVADIRAFANQITLGAVSIDNSTGVIDVVVDPAKLPPPLPLAVTKMDDSNFYTRNLADLTAWSPDRRRDTLLRLKEIPPATKRNEIALAMTKLLDDPSVEIREFAIADLATWATPDCVEPLIKALQRPRLTLQAIQILGFLRDSRAAAHILQFIPLFPQECADAVTTIGPAAEPDVLAQLHRPDSRLQSAAVKILAAIGTSQSLPDLQTLQQTAPSPLSQLAADAITAIQARTHNTQ